MEKFKDGSGTRMAEEQIYQWETDDLLEDEVKKSFQEYLFSLEKADTFYEYVEKNAKAMGYNGVSREDLVEFVQTKCLESEIYFSKQKEENKKTIRRWLAKGNHPSGDKGRESVYKLCFVLQMDADATAEFFLKGFWERPFNFKDIHEATYFFCMKNRLGYGDACRIISAIEASDADASNMDDATRIVGERIEGMGSEAEFVRYMSENRWTEKQTATEEIKNLMEACKKLASEECAQTNQGEKISVGSFESLLYVVLGYRARQQEEGKKVYNSTISDSHLPECIKSRFPSLAQFREMEKGKASHDALRKMLILLRFYQFFTEAKYKCSKATPKAEDSSSASSKKKDEKIEKTDVGTEKSSKSNNTKSYEPGELFDEYINELDQLLDDCGYMQHYWRNPYDWLFGHCAFQSEPLDALREIIARFCLEKEEAVQSE